MKGVGRLIPGVPLNVRKDTDEDLLLFKELHKRDRDRQPSLLQPVNSEEFEPNGGNNTLYRIGSGKKASGHEFFGENSKNDYDWLKTPPATPLFPSLEMEASPQQLVVQREIPILRPLSKFAGCSEALIGSTATTKATPSPLRPNNPPRSSTPNRRPSVSSNLTETKNAKFVSLIPRHKIAQLATDDPNKETNVTSRHTKQKESQTTLQASNLPNSAVVMGQESTTSRTSKLRGRGASPLVTSKIAAQIPGFSIDTPPNLRMDRAASVTRCRPSGNPAVGMGLFHQKQEASVRTFIRRQSCSPSTSRGRRETHEQASKNQNNPKGKIQTAGNGGQFLGSRMVEKVVNARKLSAAEEREGKLKPQGRGRLLTVTSARRDSATGFGGSRITSNSKTSLDLALKLMDIKQDSMNAHQLALITGRSSISNRSIN